MDSVLRELVRQRAGNQCEYCHLSQYYSELRFHVEHVRSRQHAGKDDPANLALACPECNLAKGPNLAWFDPARGRMVRLFNPRRDKWTAHFCHDDGRILGKTSIGRVTVVLLKMNDSQRVRVRLLLSESGSADAGEPD